MRNATRALVLALLCLCAPAYGQRVTGTAGAIQPATATPSGACSVRGQVRISGSAIYVCPQSGTQNWTTLGGSTISTPDGQTIIDTGSVLTVGLAAVYGWTGAHTYTFATTSNVSGTPNPAITLASSATPPTSGQVLSPAIIWQAKYDNGAQGYTSQFRSSVAVTDAAAGKAEFRLMHLDTQNGSTYRTPFVVEMASPSATTGLVIGSMAPGSGTTLTVTSSGTNENLLLTPKGTGNVVVATDLQFGGTSGPRLQANSATTVYLRNAANSAFANLYAGDIQTQSGSIAAPLLIAFNNGTVGINSSSYTSGTSNSITWGAYIGASNLGLGRSADRTLMLHGAAAGGAATISMPANSPSQITADQNNYAPGVGWFQRWSSDASRNVTGLSAGQDGQMIEIWNIGSFNIVLVNQSASSTAANRFLSSTGADLTLTPNKCAMGRYDNTTQRWRVYLCN